MMNDPMSDIAIRVEHLSKRYRLGEREPYKSLRDVIARAAAAPIGWLRRNTRSIAGEGKNYFWALDDVSFEVKQGEVVGIIGRNGAGKSTLLKILSRITKPTTGLAEIYGRVGSLLEVGTGFHPELTGRENIYLNGAILGMRRAEIDRKFDEIVAFAEIEKFLDTPVKRYSSGMYVRLAFAVAAHLEPEILLVDEVLSVGDAEFQKKCLGKMGEVAKEGRTVLFVSHNLAAVENLCDRALLLHRGEIINDASSRTVIDYYLETILDASIGDIPLSQRTDRKGMGSIRFINFWIENNNRKRISSITAGTDLILAFEYVVKDGLTLRNVDVGFSIHSISNNQTLCVLYSSYVGSVFDNVSGTGVFYCQVPKFPFAPGRYRVGARIVDNAVEADWPQDGIGYIDVESGDFYGTGSNGFGGSAPLLLSGNWRLGSSR